MKRLIAGVGLILAVSLGALSLEVIESGKFFFQIEEDVGVESFEFTRLDDGNLKLSSEFEALSEELVLEFGTERLFTQEVLLTPEFELISYELDSDTERGRLRVRVEVEGGVATISFEFTDPEGEVERGERQVILEESVITTGIAASQFLLMQEFINAKLDLAEGEEVILLAFDPSDIEEPLVELTFERLSTVTLEDNATGGRMEAARVKVKREEFEVELISCAEALEGGPCSRKGRFLGFLSSTTTLAGVRLEDAPGGGVLVVEVAPGSFAEQAGLRPGDVITHVDGQRVENLFELRQLIRFKDPEVPVVLTVERGGETLELEVRLSGSRLLVFRFDLFPKGFTVVGEG